MTIPKNKNMQEKQKLYLQVKFFMIVIFLDLMEFEFTSIVGILRLWLVNAIGWGAILRFLSNDEWFLSTRLGRRLFIRRICTDLNGTACVADSTGVSHTREHISETLAKNVHGVVCANQSWKATGWANFQHPFMDGDHLHSMQLLTYNDFYKAATPEKQKLLIAPKDFIDAPRELFASETFYREFQLQYPNLHRAVWTWESLHQTAEESQRLMPSFVNLLKHCKNWQFVVHSFGNDLVQIETQFVPLYFQNAIHMSAVQTDQEICTMWSYINDLSRRTDTIILMQEDYQRWAKQHNKDAKFGKTTKANLFTGFFTPMIRTLVLDDVKCWNLNPRETNVSFFHVNTVLASQNASYYTTVLQKHFPSVVQSHAFWGHVAVYACISLALQYGVSCLQHL